jgi:hypothetical protein
MKGHVITTIIEGSPNTRTIAALGGPGGFYGNYEANADLIVAAPELLEVAMEAGDWWLENNMRIGSDISAPWVERLWAAIAKAEGRES